MDTRTLVLAGVVFFVCGGVIWTQLRLRSDGRRVAWEGFDWFGILVVAIVTALMADMTLMELGWR